MSPAIPNGPREYYPTGGVSQFNQKEKHKLQCKYCGSSWLEEKIVNEFDAEAAKHLGSKATRINDVEFHIYVCIRCGMPVEQPLHFLGVMDQARFCHEEIIKLLTQRASEMRQIKHEGHRHDEVAGRVIH